MLKQNSYTYPWWQHDPEVVAKKLDSNLTHGLSSHQTKERLDFYGLNQLPQAKKFSLVVLFLSQFSSAIVWILIGALIVSGFLGEFIDALSIGMIILFNGIIGFFQEYHAEKSLEALRKLTHPVTRVIRNGKQQIISSLHVVPGDMIVLEAGDLIPADGRIIQSSGLLIQESALTGESISVAKTIESHLQEKLDLADRKNMAFMGTSVVQGKGVMIVTQTALDTQLGNIANILQVIEQKKTPLQVQLNRIGLVLVAACTGIVTLIFLIGVFRSQNIIQMFLTSLSLAVAAIPEGLPAVITITLALGVKRMAQKNTLVRRLTSIETLGCTSIICTDKTGTLTKNELMVKTIWIDNEFIHVTGTGYEPVGDFFMHGTTILQPREHQPLLFALKIGALCNGASLIKKDITYQICGDPTEGALLVVAKKAHLDLEELSDSNKFCSENPFSSDRKQMSVLRKSCSSETLLYVKGAPDIVINNATSILLDGKEVLLDVDKKKEVLEINTMLAAQGMRVLAVAYRLVCDDVTTITTELEQELVFVGLIAMTDSVRPEARTALEQCSSAGIQTIIITGDHQATAIAVARDLNLLRQGDLVVTGAELDSMHNEELKKKINTIRIYARTSAEHKLRIVATLRELGHIVAVTGDGVNDAPAIKAADIGIAMGITGTEVTKQASDMVITDDNFASIVSAIKEGRGIYDNLLKFISYLISANLAEILVVFWGTVMTFGAITGTSVIPLVPIHLLWINLITDGLPAIALGLDPVDPNVMQRPPRKENGPLFSAISLAEMVIMGVIVAIAALIAFKIGIKISVVHGYTMTLTTFVVLEFIRAQLIRSQFNTPIFSNPWLVVTVIASLMLHLCIVYIPWMQEIFKTAGLNCNEWLMIGAICGAVWMLGKIIFVISKKLKRENLDSQKQCS